MESKYIKKKTYCCKTRRCFANHVSDLKLIVIKFMIGLHKVDNSQMILLRIPFENYKRHNTSLVNTRIVQNKEKA